MTVSIIVYGRNDQVGYNAHKRVALSLNTIAEVLTHQEDEILFTDYNTDDLHPTQLEAISDTLTEKAKNLIKIFRIRPNIHANIATHLKINEPLSRNIAIRRSNPLNKWILSTNTDMIFIPQGNLSLSDIIAKLGKQCYYATSRFELPEALWESLDRKHPKEAIEKIKMFGERFHLNEVNIVEQSYYYDAPGDFQLAPRCHYFDIGGFDESMTRGWHVDSNFAKRYSLKYGMPESLQKQIYGYHTSHTKISGPMHSRKKVSLGNSYAKYYSSISSPYVQRQIDNWGLADVVIEEIKLNEVSNNIKKFAEILPKLIEKAQSELYVVNINKENYHEFPRLNLYHVLPYLLEQLIHQKYKAKILYVGVNARLVEKLIGFSALSTKDFQIFYLELIPFIKQFEGDIDLELLKKAIELPLNITKDHPPEVKKFIKLIQNNNIDSIIFDCGIDDKYHDQIQNIENEPGVQRLKMNWVKFFNSSLRELSIRKNKLTGLKIICVCAHDNIFSSSHHRYLNSTSSPYTTRVIHGYPNCSIEANSLLVGLFIKILRFCKRTLKFLLSRIRNAVIKPFKKLN